MYLSLNILYELFFCNTVIYRKLLELIINILQYLGDK